jgi:AcrR family transcriptional regulator
MARAVKSKRAYDSSRRREQAEVTRRRILDAAKRLFEEQGYTGTSMAEVASAAGVALKTVYLAFETKAGLLRAVWHLALRGDEEPAPVGERSWYREVLEEPDPERKVDLTVRASVIVKKRAGRLLEAIRAAAPSDPHIAALWDRIQTDFYDNQRAVVASIHRRKGLRPGLGVDRAADILWTLNHPDVWELLVRQRGWTPDEYERWFADTVCAQLLRSS